MNNGKNTEPVIENESKERKEAVIEIKEKETDNGKLRILDVGCGTGFFTILLAKQGHHVTGTDLTPDMIANSRILAKEEQVSCDFQVMDAEHLSFQDESFDVVISRNLTWTLPEAAQAYKEWTRVLKPGGLLLNLTPITVLQTLLKPPISRKITPTTSLVIP